MSAAAGRLVGWLAWARMLGALVVAIGFAHSSLAGPYGKPPGGKPATPTRPPNPSAMTPPRIPVQIPPKVPTERPDRSALDFLEDASDGSDGVPAWLSRKRTRLEAAARARDAAREAAADAFDAADPDDDEIRDAREAAGYATEEHDLARQAYDRALARHASGEPWTEFQDAIEEMILEGSLLHHYETRLFRAADEAQTATDSEQERFWARRSRHIRSARNATRERLENAEARARATAESDEEREAVLDLGGRVGVWLALADIAERARARWRSESDPNETNAHAARTHREAAGAQERFSNSADRARTIAAGGEIDHAAEIEKWRQRREEAEHEHATAYQRLGEILAGPEYGDGSAAYHDASHELSRLSAELDIARTEYDRAVQRGNDTAAGNASGP